MRKNFKAVLLAGALAGTLALAACGGDDSGSGGSDDANTLNIVGYSVLEQANAGVISAFQDTDAGKDVEFKESYGASGDQARAVIAGQDADEVHLSLEPDVQKLVDEGIVADDWKDNDTKGICTQSIVVMVVGRTCRGGRAGALRTGRARAKKNASPGWSARRASQGVASPLLFARTSAGPMVGMARMVGGVVAAQGEQGDEHRARR